MLSAKSIEQELQRIEEVLTRLGARIDQLTERMDAEHIKAAAETYARSGFRFHPDWQRQTK